MSRVPMILLYTPFRKKSLSVYYMFLICLLNGSVEKRRRNLLALRDASANMSEVIADVLDLSRKKSPRVQARGHIYKGIALIFFPVESSRHQDKRYREQSVICGTSRLRGGGIVSCAARLIAGFLRGLLCGGIFSVCGGCGVGACLLYRRTAVRAARSRSGRGLRCAAAVLSSSRNKRSLSSPDAALNLAYSSGRRRRRIRTYGFRGRKKRAAHRASCRRARGSSGRRRGRCSRRALWSLLRRGSVLGGFGDGGEICRIFVKLKYKFVFFIHAVLTSEGGLLSNYKSDRSSSASLPS